MVYVVCIGLYRDFWYDEEVCVAVEKYLWIGEAEMWEGSFSKAPQMAFWVFSVSREAIRSNRISFVRSGYCTRNCIIFLRSK